MTTCEDLHRKVLAALVHEDPMDLADPGNDLADEYDAEAREIARLLVHAGGTSDSAAVASAITETFAASFGVRLPTGTASLDDQHAEPADEAPPGPDLTRD